MRRSLKFAGVIYPPGSMSRASNSDPDAATAEERIDKLELGLSLGSRGGRILTAEDFRSPESMDSSISSNSSVSSSSGGLGDEGDSGCGGGGGWSNRGSDVVGNNASHSPNDMSHCQVVGWPPIRTCRRNNLVNMSRVTSSNVKDATHKEILLSYSSNATGGNDDGRKATHAGKSRFVKVNIDGDLIGRKVDLHTHFSYETLTFALEAMFHKPILSIYASKNGMFSKQLDGSSEFVIIYEDEDGDWMLVGDVPWGRQFSRDSGGRTGLPEKDEPSAVLPGRSGEVERGPPFTVNPPPGLVKEIPSKTLSVPSTSLLILSIQQQSSQCSSVLHRENVVQSLSTDKDSSYLTLPIQSFISAPRHSFSHLDRSTGPELHLSVGTLLLSYNLYPKLHLSS
ncbi:Auxin-responsive protein IAA10 [Platanthera guangdongensis]|uniref:Auxin-responsive protein n=1 Tax=Platanthera guangdongensis TaxID=2320717 RepID=A0ABR2M1X1_9ASPA